MNSMLDYKGYTSSICFSADDGVFHGKIEGVGELVTYEGKSVAELKRAFKEAVEDYLDTRTGLSNHSRSEGSL